MNQLALHAMPPVGIAEGFRVHVGRVGSHFCTYFRVLFLLTIFFHYSLVPGTGLYFRS